MTTELGCCSHFRQVGDRNLLLPESNFTVDDSCMTDDDGAVPDQETIGWLVGWVIKLNIEISRWNGGLEDVRQEVMNSGMIPGTGRHDCADRCFDFTTRLWLPGGRFPLLRPCNTGTHGCHGSESLHVVCFDPSSVHCQIG